jgi:hypothetical protein
MDDLPVKYAFFIVSIHYFFHITLDLSLSFAKTSAACAIQCTFIGRPHPRFVITPGHVSIHLGA